MGSLWSDLAPNLHRNKYEPERRQPLLRLACSVSLPKNRKCLLNFHFITVLAYRRVNTHDLPCSVATSMEGIISCLLTRQMILKRQ
jgi:hypothetical protein